MLRVVLGKPLSPKMGAGCQGNDERVEPFSPTPRSPGEERGWEFSSVTSGQWFNQSCLHKHTKVFMSLWVVELPGWWTLRDFGGVAHLERAWKLCPLSLCLALLISSIWRFLSFVLLSYCRSVTQSCPILCDPMDCSTPGSPVLHYLPEFAQTCPLNWWCHPTISSMIY